jgi:hypothetical protein
MDTHTINSYLANLQNLQRQKDKQERQDKLRANRFPSSRFISLRNPDNGNPLLSYFGGDKNWHEYTPTDSDLQEVNNFPLYKVLIAKGFMKPWTLETIREAAYTANIIFLDKGITKLLNEDDLKRLFNGSLPDDAKQEIDGKTVYQKWTLNPYAQYEYKMYDSATKKYIFHDVVKGLNNIVKDNPVTIDTGNSTFVWNKHIGSDPDLVNYFTVLDLRPSWYYDKDASKIKVNLYTKRLLPIKNSQFNEYIQGYLIPKVVEKYADGEKSDIYGVMMRLQRDVNNPKAPAIGEFVALKEDIKNDRFILSQPLGAKSMKQAFYREPLKDDAGKVIEGSDTYYLQAFVYRELFPDSSDDRLKQQYNISGVNSRYTNELNIVEAPSSINTESSSLGDISVGDMFGLEFDEGESDITESDLDYKAPTQKDNPLIDELESTPLITEREGKPAPQMPDGIEKPETKASKREAPVFDLDALEEEIPF